MAIVKYDGTEWQCLVEKLGETTGKVDDSDESTTEAEDNYFGMSMVVL